MKNTIVEIDELKQIVPGMPKNSVQLIKQPDIIPDTFTDTDEVVDYVKSLPAYSKYFNHKNIVKSAWIKNKLIWIILEAEAEEYSDVDVGDNPFDLDFDDAE